MRDRKQALGWATLAGAFGICCGVPVLGTLGVLGLLAGLSFASWTLIGLGTAAAVVGVGQLWKDRHRSAAVRSVAQPTPSAPDTDHVQAGNASLREEERDGQAL